MHKLLALISLFLVVNSMQAQKMFEEQLSDCLVNFTLEDEDAIIYYETGDSLMVVDFLSGLEEKQKERLAGVIMMQIMIDTTLQTCCVSYTNKTTLSDKKIDIQNRLINMQGWKRLPGVLENDNICALISIVFDKKEISVIRTGYNRNKGRKIMGSETFQRYQESLPESIERADSVGSE